MAAKKSPKKLKKATKLAESKALKHIGGIKY